MLSEKVTKLVSLYVDVPLLKREGNILNELTDEYSDDGDDLNESEDSFNNGN